jgi:hypothetical protein
LNAARVGDQEAFAQLSDPYFDATAEATDSVWVDPKGDWIERSTHNEKERL